MVIPIMDNNTRVQIKRNLSLSTAYVARQNDTGDTELTLLNW
jgi:hypothetical protein